MAKSKVDNLYKEKKILLSEFIILSDEEQYKRVENILNEMYEGKVKVTKSYILKCIKLTLAKDDDYLYLSNYLVVEKTAKELIFNFQKKRGNKFPVFILLISTLAIGIFSATYSGLIYLELAALDIDIDGDGIPDINIDQDGDRIADLNIDIDDDEKPDINVDYKGNKKPVFGLDKDEDGIPDFNLVNPEVEGEVCLLNCDNNNDGWPDYNYDIDGDGTADLDLDTDGDGIPDAGIDLNGDYLCDVMCDDDNDGVCDRNCIPYDGEDNKPSGPSDVTGSEDTNINSGRLSVVYEDFGELLVEGLVPDDQEGAVFPEKKFSVTNMSDYELVYKMTFIVDANTFTSENFQYKIDSTNGGFTQDFQTAPWEETLLSSYVTIGANETQEYVVTFKLHGTGEPQNYDQGRSFKGHIKIGD